MNGNMFTVHLHHISFFCCIHIFPLFSQRRIFFGIAQVETKKKIEGFVCGSDQWIGD